MEFYILSKLSVNHIKNYSDIFLKKPFILKWTQETYIF